MDTSRHKWVANADPGDVEWVGGTLLDFTKGSPVPVSDIPLGSILAIRAPSGIGDLSTGVVEQLTFSQKHCRLKMLIPAYSDLDPARLVLRFEIFGPTNIQYHAPLQVLEHFAGLDHVRRGVFRITTSSWEFPDRQARSVNIDASTLSCEISVLSRLRPPYVKVFYDEGIGIWDHVTGLGGIELDQLDIPGSTVDLIAVWMTHAKGGADTYRERLQVARELAKVWPSTVVTTNEHY